MTSPTPDTEDTSNVNNKKPYVNPKSTDAKTAPPLEEPYDDVSLCQSCHCMTHTIGGKCGKCRATKIPEDESKLRGCIFCKLMGTDVIETHSAEVVSFTPLNPIVLGHKLFVHEKHTDDAAHDPDIAGVVFREASLYAKAMGKPFNLITSAGEEATQTVFHLHVHYVPRQAEDGLSLPWSDIAAKQMKLNLNTFKVGFVVGWLSTLLGLIIGSWLF